MRGSLGLLAGLATLAATAGASAQTLVYAPGGYLNAGNGAYGYRYGYGFQQPSGPAGVTWYNPHVGYGSGLQTGLPWAAPPVPQGQGRTFSYQPLRAPTIGGNARPAATIGKRRPTAVAARTAKPEAKNAKSSEVEPAAASSKAKTAKADAATAPAAWDDEPQDVAQAPRRLSPLVAPAAAPGTGAHRATLRSAAPTLRSRMPAGYHGTSGTADWVSNYSR